MSLSEPNSFVDYEEIVLKLITDHYTEYRDSLPAGVEKDTLPVLEHIALNEYKNPNSEYTIATNIKFLKYDYIYNDSTTRKETARIDIVVGVHFGGGVKPVVVKYLWKAVDNIITKKKFSLKGIGIPEVKPDAAQNYPVINPMGDYFEFVYTVIIAVLNKAG